MSKCYIPDCPNNKRDDSYFCSEECRNIHWGDIKLTGKDNMALRIERLKKNAIPLSEEEQETQRVLDFFDTSSQDQFALLT